MKNTQIILISIIALLISTIPLYRVEAQNELSTAGIFARYSGAVVLVGAVISEDETRIGSGFIVTTDGLVVTNYHTVKDAKRIVLKLKNNKGYNDVKLVTFYEKRDIAFLKINGSGFKTVILGNSDSLQPGERVMTIGNPLGLESTVADGLVSSMRTMDDGLRLIQISVPLSHGSSGGPLFNLKGEVVGITAAGSIKGESLNFAVPINLAKPFIASFHNTKKTDNRKRPITPEENLKRSKDGLVIYEIKPYDTLYGLAKKFNTTVKAISELNDLTDSKLYTGQRIKIPGHK